MSIYLRLLLVIFSIVTCYFVLRKIRKFQMHIDDAIFWILLSALLVIISIFPQIATFLSKLIGFESESNFVFLSFIFILIIKLFQLSVQVSMQKHKLQTLIEEYAVKQNELDKQLNSKKDV